MSIRMKVILSIMLTEEGKGSHFDPLLAGVFLENADQILGGFGGFT